MPAEYAHSGSQNPLVAPKRLRCERSPASSWSRRPGAVATSRARRGWRRMRSAPPPARAARPKRRQQVAADRLEPRERAGVELRLGAGGGRDLGRPGVALGCREPVVADEAPHAVGDARASSWSASTGVTDIVRSCATSSTGRWERA